MKQIIHKTVLTAVMIMSSLSNAGNLPQENKNQIIKWQQAVSSASSGCQKLALSFYQMEAASAKYFSDCDDQTPQAEFDETLKQLKQKAQADWNFLQNRFWLWTEFDKLMCSRPHTPEHLQEAARIAYDLISSQKLDVEKQEMVILSFDEKIALIKKHRVALQELFEFYQLIVDSIN